MILDALLNFIPIGGNLSLVAGAGISIPSSNVIDLLGLGVGQNPANSAIIGTPANGLFGEDSGLGAIKPQVQVNIGTGLVAVGGSTLNIALQAAPDTAVTFQPGTWQTLVETGPLTAAQLAANTVCARFDWPPAFPANLQPRYMRLLFSPSAGGSFSAGTVSSAIVTMVRDDFSGKYAARNYSFSPGP